MKYTHKAFKKDNPKKSKDSKGMTKSQYPAKKKK